MPAKLTVDQGAIQRELVLPGGTVDRYVALGMGRAVQRARRAAPAVSGRLRAGIGWRNTGRRSNGSTWVMEATAAHSSWIHTARRYSPTAGRVISARAGAREFLTGAVEAEFGR